MIIFDLDHTLFNTNLLKKDFEFFFISRGVKPEIFWQTFNEAYDLDPSEPGCYSIEKQLQLLAGFGNFNQPEIKAGLKQVVFDHGKEYVHQDVFPVFDQLKSQNQRLFLITKGSESFQNLKLKATGLGQYFEKIFITKGDKIEFLKSLAANQTEVININDHPDEMAAATRAVPKLVNILIRRPYQDIPSDISFMLVRGLDEVLPKIVH